MSFLLDTDICSALVKRPAGLFHRLIQYSGRLYISSVGLGELYTWAYLREDLLDRRRKLIQDLLVGVQVLPYDERCAERFGSIRGPLIRAGHNIGGPDLMIACVALVHDLVLVTHNTSDFQNIPGLRLEDWLAS